MQKSVPRITYFFSFCKALPQSSNGIHLQIKPGFVKCQPSNRRRLRSIQVLIVTRSCQLQNDESLSINQSFLSLSDKQGGFYYGASYQANFILNYFLSNLLKFPKIFKFPLKFSISNQPDWQAKTIKATLATKASGWMVILVRRGFITVTESSPLYLSHCSFLVSLKQNKNVFFFLQIF